jgi:hypothetical protein
MTTQTTGVVARTTTPQPREILKPRGKNEKIDLESTIRTWKTKTNIIEIIKKTPKSKPLYIEITPDMAMDILTLLFVKHQRDVVQGNIDILRRAMASGDFLYTGDTIKISVTFRLLDGQHRLLSCWLTKTPFEAIIATGIADEAIVNMDLGRKRSAADALAVGGYRDFSKVLANAIKNILLYKNKGQIRSSVSDQFVSVPEVEHFRQKDNEMKRLLADLAYARDVWMHEAPHFFTLSQWITLFYILRTLPGKEEEARKFLDQFASGVNLQPTSPLLIAHKYFRNDFEYFIRGKEKKTVQRNILSLKFNVVIEAWNLKQQNVKLSGGNFSLDPLSRTIKKPLYTKN